MKTTIKETNIASDFYCKCLSIRIYLLTNHYTVDKQIDDNISAIIALIEQYNLEESENE